MSYVNTTVGQLICSDMAQIAGTSQPVQYLNGFAPVSTDIGSTIRFLDYYDELQTKQPTSYVEPRLTAFANSEFSSVEDLKEAYSTVFSDIEENAVTLWGNMATGGVALFNVDANTVFVVGNLGVSQNVNETVSPVFTSYTTTYKVAITNNGEHRHDITANVLETGTYDNGLFLTRQWVLNRERSSATMTNKFVFCSGNITCNQSYVYDDDPVELLADVSFNANYENCANDYLNGFMDNIMPSENPIVDVKYVRERSFQRKLTTLSGFGVDYDNSGNYNFVYGSIWGVEDYEPEESPYSPASTSRGGGGYGKNTRNSEAVTDDGLPGDDVIGTGLASLYNPTKSEMNDFTQFLFSGITDNIANILKRMFMNPIEAVITAHMCHTRPRSNQIETIMFCGFDSGCQAYSIGQFETIVYTFEFSDSRILRYDNFSDFSNTQLQLFLPYSGLYDLDISQFINGGMMTVRYKLDFLSGNCYISVEANTPQINGNSLVSVVKTFTGNFCSPIPLSSINYQGLFSSAMGALSSAVAQNPVGVVSSVMSAHLGVDKSGSINTNFGFMGKQKPYVIIKHPELSIPYKYEQYKGYPSNMYHKMEDLTKYIKVDKTTLWSNNIHCTDNERSEIIDLLENGVWIEE